MVIGVQVHLHWRELLLECATSSGISAPLVLSGKAQTGESDAVAAFPAACMKPLTLLLEINGMHACPYGRHLLGASLSQNYICGSADQGSESAGFTPQLLHD